jgi:hypothetical protein
MAYTLTIDGVDVAASLLMPGSVGGGISVSSSQNGTSSLSFSLRQATTGTLAPSVDEGDLVVLTDTDSSDKLFGGFVHDIESTEVTNNASGTYTVVHRVTAIDYSGITRHRLINEVYSNKTLLQIVTAINTDWLDGEVFTVTGVETGPTLTKVVLPWQHVSDALDTLAEMTGYAWWIDGDKDIHFAQRTTTAGSYAISGASRPFISLSVNRSLAQYANVVLQRGGKYIGSTRTENLFGDGKRRVFNVAYPVAEKPSGITDPTGAIAAGDIGIRGLDTGKKYYWSKNQTEIEHDESETVLGSADVLTVAYKGLVPIVIEAENAAEIAARVTASPNTSGRFETIQVDAQIEDLTEASDKAEGYLSRFGTIPKEVSLVTDTNTLRVGQLVSVVLPELALSGEYLVDSLSMMDRSDGNLRTTAKLLSGESLGGWQRFWRQRVGPAKQAMLDAFITKLRNVGETLTITPTETVTSPFGAPWHTYDVTEYGWSSIYRELPVALGTPAQFDVSIYSDGSHIS